MRSAAQGRVQMAVLLLAFLLAGCQARKLPVYQNNEGFRFAPPPGWVQRVRGENTAARAGHAHRNLPLPPLGVAGQHHERLLVRYDRLSTGQHAWLRVSLVECPASTPLKPLLSTRLPAPGWKRESEAESLEIDGLPAARIAFVGRWSDRDYLCETTAARNEGKIYLFSASFPSSESATRELVRQAVARAAWR